MALVRGILTDVLVSLIGGNDQVFGNVSPMHELCSLMSSKRTDVLTSINPYSCTTVDGPTAGDGEEEKTLSTSPYTYQVVEDHSASAVNVLDGKGITPTSAKGANGNDVMPGVMQKKSPSYERGKTTSACDDVTPPLSADVGRPTSTGASAAAYLAHFHDTLEQNVVEDCSYGDSMMEGNESRGVPAASTFTPEPNVNRISLNSSTSDADQESIKSRGQEGSIDMDGGESTSVSRDSTAAQYVITMAPGSVLQIGNANSTAMQTPPSRRPQPRDLDYTDESSSGSEISDEDLSQASSVSRPRSRASNRGDLLPLTPMNTRGWRNSDVSNRPGEENSYRTASPSSNCIPSHEQPSAQSASTCSADEGDANCPNTFHTDVYENMFYGREKELQKVLDVLQKKGGRKVGVSGMGGAGKTTFVSLFADRNRDRYKNGMFFVDASMKSTLPVEFAKLAGPDVLNLVQQPTEDLQRSMALVLEWLTRNRDYLLVFDAADDEKTLELLGKQSPKGYRFIPPRMKLRGHVIITSQCPREKFQAVQIMDPIVLGDLDERSSQKFLWERVYPQEETEQLTSQESERQSLENLVCKRLPGRLPIHLEQTASYIRGMNHSFNEYEAALEMAENKHRNPINDPCFGDNTKSVDVTFKANFLMVEEKSASAFCLLRLAALCHSQKIPLTLFTIGSLALLKGDISVNEDFGGLQEYLLEAMGGDSDVPISSAREKLLPAKQLLICPRQRQLVKYDRGAEEFTVHEVIQEQLRLLMKERGEIHEFLELLANILIFLLTTDDLDLAEKKEYLSHAEACARNMDVFGFTDKGYTHLYLKLRIKTAYVFATLGAFSEAMDIIDEVERKIPQKEAKHIQMMLLGLYAFVYFSKENPLQALEYAAAADQLDFDIEINPHDKDIAYELAVIKETYAKARLSVYDVSDDVVELCDSSISKFESLQEKSHINCQNHIARLFMLKGELHERHARQLWLERRDQLNVRQEFGLALRFFDDASKRMDQKTITWDELQVLREEMKLKASVPTEAEQKAAIIQLQISCRSLEGKVTEMHPSVVSVLSKMANIWYDLGNMREVLKLLERARKCLDEIYEETDGTIQKGEIMYAKGRALFKVQDYNQSSDCMRLAIEKLQSVPLHPAYRMARNYLKLILRKNGS